MVGPFARRATGLLVLAGGVFVLFAQGACEAIVPDQVPAYTCSGTSLTDCPPGMYCKGAGCAPCLNVQVCNGYDNNCDGKVDEGYDKDGDGYTTCGVFDATSGAYANADCNDNDATIHPAAQEICNGIDDNCDGIIDNPNLVCPAGEVCVAALKECIGAATACTMTGCPSGQVCDPMTQTCNAPPNTTTGQPCSSNAACTTGVCGTSTILGSSFSGANGSVCTQPCCTSADCADGYVCFAPGTGGTYCVASSSMGLGRSTPGAGTGGASCKAGTDCRSGLCGTGGTCVDTCCGDSDCTNGTACSLSSVTGQDAFLCVASSGSAGANASCDSDSDCKDGFCFDYGFDEKRCVTPCCGSTMCGTVNLGAFGTYPTTCYDFTNQDDSQLGNSVVAGCVATMSNLGNGAVGATCSKDSDCASGRCDSTAMLCTDVCCKSSDCPSGWTCLPTAVGSSDWLRCTPPAP